MVTIVKGNDKIVCTKGTFEEQYKILGYQIASEEKEATEKVASLKKAEEEEVETQKEKAVDYEKELTEKYQIDKPTGRKRK